MCYFDYIYPSLHCSYATHIFLHILFFVVTSIHHSYVPHPPKYSAIQIHRQIICCCIEMFYYIPDDTYVGSFVIFSVYPDICHSLVPLTVAVFLVALFCTTPLLRNIYNNLHLGLCTTSPSIFIKPTSTPPPPPLYK